MVRDGLREAFATLATQIADARVEAGLRQEDVARLCGLGTSTVRMIERGTHEGPGLVGMLTVLAVLDLPLAALSPLAEAVRPPAAGHPDDASTRPVRVRSRSCQGD